MKNVLFTTCLALLYSLSYSQENWVIDPVHSTIQFDVSHMTVSSVSGIFTSFSGTMQTAKANSFEDAKVTVSISAASITTYNMERDAHLREDDFFNAEKYPTITFKSTDFSIEPNGDFRIAGDLTIRDVTRSVTLNGKHGGIVLLNNQRKAGFTAETTIDRFQYGLKWDDVLDSGGLVVGQDVKITVNVELIKQ